PLVECFLFQAEDGIRVDLVTGVQTCALRISLAPRIARRAGLSVIARGQRVPPSAGPMINSATKQSILSLRPMDCFAEPVIGRALDRKSVVQGKRGGAGGSRRYATQRQSSGRA